MPIRLDAPLAWTQRDPDEEAMLKDLQGNILKGHGRDYTCNVFLHFDVSKRDAARAFVKKIASELPSALAQLEGAEHFKQTGQGDETFTAFFLSARGYGALGRTDFKPTENADAFEDDMAARAHLVNDPPQNTWNKLFRHDIHAMLLIADDSEAARAHRLAKIKRRIRRSGGAVQLLGIEEGRAMRNTDGHGIEHFGYVDGRSQPLMLVEDLDHEKNDLGGTDQWDPKIPLKQVQVQSPGGTAQSFGSYFVFRKLEQNVRGFKKDEKRLAGFLGLAGDATDPDTIDERDETAGAFVVGRFENGRPVTLQGAAGDLANVDVPNNFNFKADNDGLKCPFAGHIRKANPRGGTETKFNLPPGSEIVHLMARRGITYGHRAVHPSDPNLDFEDMPTGDVGLLFMAYQSNLADQFEFTQQSWVNNPDFLNPATGADPVIGQSFGPTSQHWPTGWNQPLKAEPFDFSKWVTLQGGGYFFAPSISTLKAL